MTHTSVLEPKPAVPSSQDRRAQRTKNSLRGAFVTLIEEVGYDAITVGDLCLRADITRGTFYNHHKDKDALREALEEDFLRDVEQLQARLAEMSMAALVLCIVDKKPIPYLVELFDYLRERGDFLHAILGPGGDVSFGPRLRDTVCTCLIERMLHERYRTDSTPFVRYYVAFFASAYLGVICQWLETGMQESSEEMALISQRLLCIQPGEPITL